MKCGDTFDAGDEYNDKLHLQVVVTDPFNGEVATVSVMSLTARADQIVKLKAGDHPRIIKDSVVAFGFAKIRRVEDIEAAFKADDAIPRPPMDPKIVKRIQEALMESDFTPNGVRWFYEEATKANEGGKEKV